MPKTFRRYLNQGTLEAHFFRALLLALGLRLVAAWFVYGPQALDDYKHGVWPAYQIFAGLPFDLPEYRSPLLNWLLAAPLYPAAALGLTSARAEARVMYVLLGLISLLGIYGTYHFAKRERSKLWGRLALYLVAAHPLMPFVSTRAFGEAVAAGLVPLGFGLLPGAAFFGFLTLGLATLFRFHVGLLFVGALAITAYRRNGRAVAKGIAAGVLTLLAEILIDVGAGRAPLATLLFYLKENEGGGARYGVSPWYNPALFLLVLTAAPASFVLARGLGGLWRRHRAVLVPWLAFVVAHSLVAHKEERFLYPVVGLELWALAYLWAAGSRSPAARRVFTPIFLAVVGVGLGLGCLVNTQAGEIEPPAEIGARYRDVIYLDHQSLFGASRVLDFFLRPPAELDRVEAKAFTATRVDDELARRPERQAVALLTSDRDARERLRTLAQVETARARCGRVTAAQSPIDRLLYFLNPRHNQRRRPTWYLICERTFRADP